MHRVQEIPRDGTAGTWPSWPTEYPKEQSEIESQEKDTDQPPYPPGSLPHQYEDIDSMTPESEDTRSGQDRLNVDKKGTGSLIVNEVGDLQYLGKNTAFFILESY